MSRHGPVETAFLGVHRLLARDEAHPVLLPDGAGAGWGSHPVESAAFARRTQIAAMSGRRPVVKGVSLKLL
jgi:hypothetical protein